jgi:hypothetical protein
MYSRYTWDGQVYSEADWRLRQKREPLAEIFQIKGAQECALGVGATDEECAFAQVLDPCEPGETYGCAFQTGFVRQGLKVGLELEQELGFNPLQVGFIAATDSHNSNPGDVEEWDFPGAVGAATSSAARRLRETDETQDAYKTPLKFHTSGGLAAVWAPENTREAIFDALARRETYATSGPRMAVRFYAGWGIDEAIAGDTNAIQSLQDGGVPMGGVLHPNATTFLSGRPATQWTLRCNGYRWSRAGSMPRAKPRKKLSILPAQMDSQWIQQRDAARITVPM